MTAPFMPAKADIRDFPCMMLAVAPLRDSDFTLLASPEEFRAGVLLWAAAWHQLPAGSLPNDDRLLAGLARVEARRWLKLRAMALRGWVECSDGRLYHRMVAEKALECWLAKLASRVSSGAGNQKRHGTPFDRAALDAEIETASALLANLNPKSRKLTKPKSAQEKVDAGREPIGAPDTSQPLAVGSPVGNPWGSQEKGREEKSLPERTQGALSNPGKEAWERVVRLLKSNGRLTDAKARTFFGGLLRYHKLEPGDLLSSIVRAEGLGTPDPQGYLTGAAKAFAGRRGPGSPTPTAWGDDVWRTAVELYRQDPEHPASWSARMGPTPDDPGCEAPAAILAEFGFGPSKVVPFARSGAA